MTECDGRRPATLTSAAGPARAPAPRRAIAMLGALGAVAAAGCGDSAPHGPPVLLKVYWETRGGVQTLIWSSTPTDGPLPNIVPPAATQFDLVFDRVIDGSKIEDTTIVNGVSTQMPKKQPGPPMQMPPVASPSPVTVTWPGMFDAAGETVVEPAGQDYALSVWYNSIHLPSEAANTSYVYGRETPSYPSNTPLSIKIDAQNITSKYNEPMAEVDPITVTTEPFGVMINPAANANGTAADDAGPPPPAYVPTNFGVPLQFNNVPVNANPTMLAAGLPQYLQVRLNGALLTPGQYQVQVSPSDPTLILLKPGTIQVWDSGGKLDVTVSAGLPDIYGGLLDKDVTASFLPCQLAGDDAGVRICAPPNHGGGSDAGVNDGGAAPDVAAADAGAAGDDAGADSAVD